jgi:hypothetical protein
MTKQELAYMAGIIDGEGSICIWTRSDYKRNTDKYFCVSIHACSTDKILIDWIDLRWPGTRGQWKKTSPGRPMFQWERRGQKAIKVLKAIEPWLLIKKAYVPIAVKMQDTIAETRKFHEKRVSNETVNKRRLIYADYLELADTRKAKPIYRNRILKLRATEVIKGE